MALLILGLLLWSAMHLLPMVAPAARAAAVARLGEGPWKGLFSLVVIGAVALMVVGYRGAGYAQVYVPPAWGIHLNNLLMLAAMALFGARDARGRLRQRIRHPMLWGMVLWAAAHLSVRGDLASLLLWGGLAAWAVAAMLATNARDGAWARPAGGTLAGDLRHGAIALAAFAIVALLHWQVFGYRPFP